MGKVVNKALGQRVAKAREEAGLSQAQLAKAVGMRQSAIGEIEAGRVSRPKKLREIAREVHRTEEYLLGEGEIRTPAPKISKDDFRYLGAFDQGASAGPGSFVQDGHPVPMHHLAFRRDWLREITSASDEYLFVLFADGNSMSPTIHNGDTMLVDKMQINPRKDGIYVFMWDGFLNVKRLTSDPATKTISITSDNPVHKSFSGAKPDDIQVIGRVIWVGRKV